MNSDWMTEALGQAHWFSHIAVGFKILPFPALTIIYLPFKPIAIMQTHYIKWNQNRWIFNIMTSVSGVDGIVLILHLKRDF